MGNINKNKDNKKKKKLPFGRNIFTLIFVFACVAVLFIVVYSVQSYVTAASEAKYTPFITQSISDGKATDFEEGSFNNIDERMKHDKFNTMGVYVFNISSFIECGVRLDALTPPYKYIYEKMNIITIMGDNNDSSTVFCRVYIL